MDRYTHANVRAMSGSQSEFLQQVAFVALLA